jgi:hypothetical protein
MNTLIKKLVTGPMRMIGILVGFALLPAAGYEVNATITTTTTPTGTAAAPFYLIGSDVNNTDPLYNRDSIPASMTVSYSRVLGKGAKSEKFRAKVQLLGPDNAAVTLSNANLGSNAIISAEQTITLALASSTATRTYDFAVRPAVDLGAGKSYRLRYELQIETIIIKYGVPTIKWVSADGPVTKLPFTAVHFSDDPQNSAAKYVRVYPIAAPAWIKTHLITTGTTTIARGFGVNVPYFAARYDLGGSYASILYRLTATVTDDTGAEVPLQNGGQYLTSLAMFPSVVQPGSPLAPRSYSGNFPSYFRPVSQLDSRNRTFRIQVRVEHLEVSSPTTYLDDGESPQTTALQRLLHFNGNLGFGNGNNAASTVFSAISNTPAATSLGTNLVNTSLSVTAGTIPGFPDYSFGDGSALGVQLLSGGTAVVVSGSQPVTVANGGNVSAKVGNITVSYPGTWLDPSGPQASVALVHLPQGLSFTPNRLGAHGRYFANVQIPGPLSLTSQFRHPGVLSLSAPPNAWVFDESRPLLYQVSDFSLLESGHLDFTAADAEWVHQAAFDQLEAQHAAGQHETPSMGRRLTNEGHFRFSEVNPGSTVTFDVAADGTARTAHAELNVQPGEFVTHFPRGVPVQWASTGTLEIQDGKITAGSVLPQASPLLVQFDATCLVADCGPPPGTASDSVTLFPKAQLLKFTPDGGLWAEATNNPKTLSWGIRGDTSFTHRSDAFQNGFFLASGHQLYASDNPLATSGPLQAQAATLAPGVITLAGYDSKAHLYPVLPETVRYRNGIGIYPGATFIVDESGRIGASRLADQTSEYPYQLQKNVTKYYVRPSGVSGRHVASEGSFDPNLTLYGYDFELTRFQLTFLSNVNKGSWVDGSVSVPFPSGFTQSFLGLRIGCTGSLKGAEIDPKDAGPKPLAYWNGSFTPMAMNFAPQVGASCYDDRFLTLGLISGAANLAQPLAGSLAFKPNGNISTLAPSIVGADGRLGLPSLIRLNGPGSEKYPLVPVSKLYFNNPSVSGAPASGYVGFAAACNVPFFQDLKVHVMTSAQAGVPAPIHMAGGWTAGGKTFFSNSKFDPTHRGFPPGTTVPNYQNPQAVTPFVVHASQSLFGLVPLDYPLKWISGGRYFESWPSAPTDLLVLKVVHQVDYLSSENAEISFGAQYEGLPKINLVSSAVSVVAGQTGAARALTEAAQAVVTKTLNRGVDEIGNLIDDTMESVLEKALDSMETEIIRPLYVSLEASYNSAANNTSYQDWVNTGAGDLKNVFDNRLGSPLNAGAATMIGRLNQLSDATADAASLVQRVSDAVDGGILAIDSVVGQLQTYRNQAGDVVTGLPGFTPPAGYLPVNDLVNGILAKIPNGNGAPERAIVQKLVRELIGELAPPNLAALLTSAFTDADSEINAELNALLVKFDPTLERVAAVLMEARGYLEQVKVKLGAQGDLLVSFQQIITNAQGEIQGVVAGVRSAAYAYIDRVASAAIQAPGAPLGAAGNLLDEFNEDEFVAMIRGELRDRLLASAFIQQIQYSLRQTISEFDIALRSAIDSAFNEVNRMCKELIKEALGPIDDAINGLTGDINSYVGAGSVDGYAHIQGDTLRRLRLDAKVELKVPDDMALQAYFEMLCYDSETTTGSAGCLTPGQQVVEVKIGALDVPLDWVSPDLRADFGVWFSMQTAPTVRPRGIGGSLVMTGGELNFQSLEVTGFAASVAVGSAECYLAASASVAISGYEAAGGIFFGRTCSLEPLLLVDPDVASLLGTPPFTGAYVYGEVWIPISEVVLGIPASCFFRVSAGVGAGAFYFAEGPTYGGKMLLGVSGEALCVVSIRGDVSLTGVMSGGSLRFSGLGNLTGKAGYCPFCLKFKESAKITYQDGSWDVDF